MMDVLSLSTSLGISLLFSEELRFLCMFLRGFEAASLKEPVYPCVNGISIPQIFILLHCQTGASVGSSSDAERAQRVLPAD